ncbi:hypothetical protein AKO1_002241 [Acrasis kona]|uniref:Uncharacterized protein n=1 Tax=Acrasis kona TaxID=1008807 RepID=A0AAW2ZAU2_9EUKA
MIAENVAIYESEGENDYSKKILDRRCFNTADLDEIFRRPHMMESITKRVSQENWNWLKLIGYQILCRHQRNDMQGNPSTIFTTETMFPLSSTVLVSCLHGVQKKDTHTHTYVSTDACNLGNFMDNRGDSAKFDDYPRLTIGKKVPLVTSNKPKTIQSTLITNIQNNSPWGYRYPVEDGEFNHGPKMNTQYDIVHLKQQTALSPLDVYPVPYSGRVQEGNVVVVLGYPTKIKDDEISRKYRTLYKGTIPTIEDLGRVFTFGIRNYSFGYVSQVTNNFVYCRVHSSPGFSGGPALIIKDGRFFLIGMLCNSVIGVPMDKKKYGATVMSVNHPAFVAVYGSVVFPTLSQDQKKLATSYMMQHESVLKNYFDVNSK